MADLPGLLGDYRPRYGAVNRGYDMGAARQYPQPTTEDLLRLGLTGAGAGIGAFQAAPFLALAGAMGSRSMTPVIVGTGAIGLGGLAGRRFGNEVAEQYANGRDAQRQHGGFYGERIPRFPGDAEAQPGGFYGRR